MRSARTTDIAILPQLGTPLLAWSGGNAGVVGAVRASPSIIDRGFDVRPSGYARDGGRRAPHNLYVAAGKLLAGAPDSATPPGPLFAYRTPGQANLSTAEPAAGVDLIWGPQSAAPAAWRWDPALRLYLRSQRGRPHVEADGARLTASNVVVLVTEYGQSPADTRSPEAHTVGSGEAFVYTNGVVVHGRWDRPEAAEPATVTDEAGTPVLLTPGNTWIELPSAGGVTTVR